MKGIKINYIKPLLVAASLVATGAAWSQSRDGIQIYGMIDQGVEAVNGKSTGATERSTVYRVSNGMITPHFGFRSSEDLGGGMKAGFNLEGSFAADDGTSGIGGRLWGRQAHVDLSGSFGALSLGRQYTMVRYGFADANPFGTGNQGLRLLDPRISNPRADNSITYLVKYGPISGGVNYSFGWDGLNGNPTNSGPATVAAANCPGEAMDHRQCREVSVGMKYAGGSWGVSTSYERLNGGTSGTFGGLTSPSKTDTRFVLGGHMTLSGGTKLTAGWIKRNNMGVSATPKSNMVWVEGIGVAHVGALYFDGLLAQLKYDNSPNKAVLLNARARYVLSKRTSLYVTTAYLDNSGTLALSATASTPAIKPVAGSSQTSVIAGINHRF